MITLELGSISLLSLLPFYIFRQSRVFGVFGEEKVSVKFTEILNKSHNWKKCSNKEVTKLLKRSIQTSKGPVAASKIIFLVNRVCFIYLFI